MEKILSECDMRLSAIKSAQSRLLDAITKFNYADSDTLDVAIQEMQEAEHDLNLLMKVEMRESK